MMAKEKATAGGFPAVALLGEIYSLYPRGSGGGL
jgi:hypothetical protein